MSSDLNYIGSYRLLKLVRGGANCQIWEAIHDIDNQRCALKILKDEFRSDKEHIALMRNEYQVGHLLNHPCVIEIYEFSISKGVPFLALQYFESSNLKQWIREVRDVEGATARLPEIIRQAAQGLGHLHEHDYIHRDVKPDNFLINREYEVKLIDFAIAQKQKKGLARLFGGRSKIQGTRSYMAPEQIRGETLDQRSDIYSFGCMLFELYCGRPPFTGGSPDELLQKHLRAPVPSMLANTDAASNDFAQLVQQMMAKDREERPASMSEFLERIDAMRAMRAPRR